MRHLISKDGVWNDDFGHGHFDLGYTDLANSVDYATSHDVADAERMMNYLLGSILQAQALGPGDLADVRAALETAELHPSQQSSQRNGAVDFALYRLFGIFALLLTSIGMPMFLAGEEFGDVHDLDFSDVESKQQDPVQFRRLAFPGHHSSRTKSVVSSHCARAIRHFSETKSSSSTSTPDLTTTTPRAYLATPEPPVIRWAALARSLCWRIWARRSSLHMRCLTGRGRPCRSSRSGRWDRLLIADL